MRKKKNKKEKVRGVDFRWKMDIKDLSQIDEELRRKMSKGFVGDQVT